MVGELYARYGVTIGDRVGDVDVDVDGRVLNVVEVR